MIFITGSATVYRRNRHGERWTLALAFIRVWHTTTQDDTIALTLDPYLSLSPPPSSELCPSTRPAMIFIRESATFGTVPLKAWDTILLLRSMSGINIDNAAEREHESYFYRFTRILIRLNSSESIPETWTKSVACPPPLSQLKWSEISRYNNIFFIGPWSNILMIMAGFGQL